MAGGPTPQHQVVKPQVLANTSVGLLEQELVLPSLFQRTGIDKYKGAENDSVSVKVEGVLPHHDYAWRNDRSTGITYDVYSERKITVSFGGNTYSAVKLTDEQNDMDIDGWGKLLRPQVRAVARGLERKACNYLINAPYNVVVGDAQSNLKGSLIEARRVLNAFHAPGDDRILVVGTDWESLLLADTTLGLAQNVGESEAASMLTQATLGRRYGFRFIVDQTIASDAAYAFASSGFIFLNAAPSVPQSVPFGATASLDGITMRWLRDYDTEYFQDRSVVNTYNGFQTVKDPLIYWDATLNGGNGQEVVTSTEYFVRGIKLVLDGASTYPVAGTELAKATNVTGPGKHLAGTAAGTLVND